MTPNELVELGTKIVRAGEAQGLTLRLYGGIAIYARCSSIESHTTLQRANADVDLIAAADAWERLPAFMTAQGFTQKAGKPHELQFSNADTTLEFQSTKYQEDFSFDLSERLKLVPLTLPLADLLLLKLARVDFREKDIQDASALLVDHRVTDGGDEEEEINRAYLYPIVNKQYRLWKTVFDNTVTLEKVFDKYLEPEEGQLAWRRIELLQEVFDGKSHPANWWLGRLTSVGAK